jgi:ectoine hydroxylase-related dioxygenase (phytanoyl-CoA dioxygenase family)
MRSTPDGEIARALEELRARGVAVIEGVLSAREAAAARAALVAAAKESERRGAATFMPELDPNDANVRVFNLLDLHAVFRELIVHPVALALVRGLLGEHFAISNFTANIALPGSQSMELHSDQGIVVPEPWFQPWSINVIWCLNDVDEENGATRYVPGSHRIQRASEVPADARAKTVPFKASAGSIAVTTTLAESCSEIVAPGRAPVSRSILAPCDTPGPPSPVFRIAYTTDSATIPAKVPARGIPFFRTSRPTR